MHKYEVALAINASMYKWRRIAEAPHLVENSGCDDCTLCQMFFEGDCYGCPLYIAIDSCYRNDIYIMANTDSHYMSVTGEYCLEPDKIYAFYDFLCSLLDQPVWD